MPFLMEYPNDYSTDYYQQLYAEQWTKETGRKYWKWVKIRDRNEILDCTVYNLAMFYHLGLGRWTAAQWDSFDKQQKMSASSLLKKTVAKAPVRRRIISRGVDQ